jgi:MFS family permease
VSVVARGRRRGQGVGVDRRFGWLWTAYAVSTFGTWLAFDAFPLIAILVLNAGPAAVSALAAAGPAAGALAAVPLGPWVEFRRKRPVMIGTDLVRAAALLTIPAAYALGALSLGQLALVSVVTGAADIAFKSASGAYLKHLVPGPLRLRANARFEQTTWTATLLGPPAGGAAIGLFGPLLTVVANALSFVGSAVSLRLIRDREAPPERDDGRTRPGDLLEGWRHILRHPALRALFANTVLVNALILATAPLIAVLMLGRLGFAPWQYGLAFGAPCAGGLLGARLSGPLTARFGGRAVLLVAGTLRACWSLGLAFVRPGTGGLILVIAVQFGLVTSVGVFNPVFATYRLEESGPSRVTRVLSAWSVTSTLTVAGVTALWGLLAAVVGPRAAIAAAGVLLLATPLLLYRRAVGVSLPRIGV